MDENAKKDSLKLEMHQTARELGEKFDQLEGALFVTFQETKEIVDKVVDTVTQTAQTLSPVHQIRKNPLAWTGGATAVGFVACRLALRPRLGVGADLVAVARSPEAPRLTSGRRSLLQAIAQDFAPELRSLREVLLLSATKYAADALRARSSHYNDQISQFEANLQSRFSRV